MEDEISGINVIPLVDIMLVLITIVLITSNFMVRGLIPVSLPKSQADGGIVKEVINIDMTSDGTVYFKEEKVTYSELFEKLLVYDKELQVLINADRDMAIQPFVTVMDLLKSGGFTKISIQTEK